MFSANDSPAEEYLQGILPTLTEFEFELDFQVLKNWQNFLCLQPIFAAERAGK